MLSVFYTGNTSWGGATEHSKELDFQECDIPGRWGEDSDMCVYGGGGSLFTLGSSSSR